MNTPETVVVLEIAFIAVLGIYFIVLLYRWWRFWLYKKVTYLPKVDATIAKHLKYLEYYQLLSEQRKKEFVKRIRYLAKYKKFKGMDGQVITDEIRANLSATIVQITFGFKKSDIAKFNEIMVFPDTFFHPATKVQMKGFTSANGQLAVSWPDYVKGYAIGDDNYNLGLHELAHALHINAARSRGNEDFKWRFKDWTERSLDDYYALKNLENDFFRQYGGTNFHEFFAVVVEHFFESPAEFLKRIPQLYIRTCILLNQNPLNVKSDYAFDISDFPQYNRSKK
ncbi:MAG: Mlc titration factor MtfA (ptsG expression regulator) [Bacteroidia bacterium]